MASSGGLPPPCSILTAPCSSETAVPHRARRSRPCWRTCFCITRSTRGWAGSSRRYRSNATPTTAWCTASADAKRSTPAGRSGTGWPRSGCGCIPTRPGSCTARTAAGVAPGSTRPSRSWGTRSGPAQPVVLGGNVFAAFLPAISKEALKRLSRTVRRWQLHRRTELSRAELAEMINPVVRGWMQYYGAFYRSALSMLLARINTYLGALEPQEVPTATCPQEGPRSLGPRHHAVPRLLRPLGVGQVPRDDQDGTSGVTGDCHAPFRGSPGVGFPRAT
jgi:hypothetical protein